MSVWKGKAPAAVLLWRRRIGVSVAPASLSDLHADGNSHAVRNVLTELLMVTSRLTSKAQTTIPQPIRAALQLQLREGDEISDSIEGYAVVIRKAPVATPPEDRFGTFSEWDSEADRRACARL